jgi:hypothetical protein
MDVVEDRRRLVLDDGWRIIGEYRNKLSPTGQPGLGDRFLKWVLTNWASPERCERVTITPKPGDDSDFQEFPSAPGLETFDPSDRKFVAVAHAHTERPPILQGVDSKWWGWKEVLASAGIPVKFLCPDEVQATYIKKFGKPVPRKDKKHHV